MRFLQAPLNGDSQHRRPRTLNDIARDVVAATNADVQSLDAEARSRVLTAIRRVFAWLHHWRRVVTRREYRAETFLGFLQLACARILLRHFMR